MRKLLTNILDECENKLGIYFTSFIIASLMVLLSSIFYSLHSANCDTHSTIYSLMSENPFIISNNNQLQFRLLSPFLAYFLFLRGNLFFLFTLLMGLFFLFFIYLYFRKRRSYDVFESLVFTAIFAFSANIFVTVYWPSRIDTTSYLMIMLFIYFMEKKWSVIFLALSLFNHPSNLLLFPALLVLYTKNCYPKFNIKYLVYGTITFLLVLIPFFIWREYVNKQVLVLYDFSYYFNPQTMKETLKNNSLYFPIGAFMTYKIFWFIPIYGLILSIKKGDSLNGMFLYLALIGVIVQLLVAEDITRMLALAFPSLIVGIDIIKKNEIEIKYSTLFLWNLLIPTVYVTGAHITSIYPFWIKFSSF